ncbi:MAG: HipA domain-containing protein [Fibromonadales bacterium]|nr:HipA domain-containing protein [Fibromonadales bacterium]
MPANEHITMQIAKQVFDLDIAENALVFFPDKTPAYLTKRFDVLPSGQKIKAEDFAQLAGIEDKYEFSYQKMAEVLRNVVGEQNYLENAEKLFKAIVFNYLMCNGDAHVKNFSVLYPLTDPPKLAPFYDLLNTRLHLPTDSFMALDLFDDGGAIDFFEFGLKIGLDSEIVDVFLKGIQSKVDKICELLDHSDLSSDAIAKYKYYVLERAKMLKRNAYAEIGVNR